MLQVQNIEKYYGSRNNVTKALDRVSFDVADGEFMAVMGASGSGKTTLLNCISTIDTVSAGNIFLDGENIAELPAGELARFRRERLGFVFQDFNLLDTLTVEENIGLALSLNYHDAGKVQKQVKAVAGHHGYSWEIPLSDIRGTKAAGGLRKGNSGRTVIDSGRRAHGRAGFQSLQKSSGNYDADESGNGRHNYYGHPRRIQRQLRLAGVVFEGRARF